MRWYEGDIAQAVAISKEQNAVFVVYVQGVDAKSVNLTSIINDDEIASQLESATFVAIKVEAGTVSHNQFTAIFKAVPVPSIFFIGKNGAPIDIVTDATVTDLANRINKVIEVHTGRLADINTPAQTSDDFLKSEQQSPAVAETFVESASSSAEPVLNESATLEEEDVEEEEEKNKISKEDKIQRAKELLEQKRLAKKQEEDELARAKEIERRKMGQDVQKMRRTQQDADMKALMEERQRTRNEEKAARDRILAQIAQDKADRASKFSSLPSPASVGEPTTRRPPQISTNTARLQFRMPDGSHMTSEFDSTATLLEVREFVMQNLTLPFRNFTLSTTFPRREFTVHQNNDTLRDLELCPNAVILVLQGHSSGIVTSNSSSGIFSLFWLLVSPIVGFFGYFRHLIFGPNGSQQQNDAPRNTSSAPPERSKSPTDLNATKQQQQQQQPPQPQPTIKRKTAETSVVRRQGTSNIHRLSDRTDSDEDNNTWNGNSTQQM